MRMNKKGIAGSLAVVVLLLGVIGYFNRGQLAMLGFNWFLRDKVESTLENSYKPIDGREPVPISQVKGDEDKPLAMLLLGVDQRGKEVGRSDTMIYTIVRPKDGAVLMVSIPRDTYVEIAGRGKKDKITHAYAFGGAKMSLETVESFFQSPVDHYAAINFAGFRDVIDAMGGISLPIEEDIINKDPDHEHFVVKAGQDVYNGKDALNYVRYREDAGGDMSRTKRHQTFLSAMLDKASQVGQWTKIPEFVGIMGDNFNTDLRPDQMIDLGQAMLQTGNRTIYSYTLKGEGHRLQAGGAWYFFADEQDLADVRRMIASWMDGDTRKSDLIIPEANGSVKSEKPVQSLSTGSGTAAAEEQE
ncbi:LCP family protein [Paenibacillus sp. NPDC058071]|uniref:LCP family protein n=1 Tax=Paenibacillus sp. NPDC058071 TaxID=3346326 RepID=UPI0036D8DFBA